MQNVCAESPFYQNQYANVDKKIEVIVDNMTIDEKIGQMIILSIRDWGFDAKGSLIPLNQVNDDVARIIAKYHLGGFLVSTENCQTTEATVRFTTDLQHAAISSGNIPLLIVSDEEGGIITRVEQDTTLPGNMAVGATGNSKCAYECGRIIGEELFSQGINCTFAPVGDVNDNPNNPVINVRSFGSDPDMVAKFTVAMQHGIESTGTIACVKHFPGHGNTSTDSHSEFAIVNKTLAEWNACERVPFELSIKNGIDMVMVAHVQVPALDDSTVIAQTTGEQVYLPATTSKRIVTGVLRNELGFNGVVVSDAMFMKSLTDVFGEQESVVKVIGAGVDMLCNPVIITSEDTVQNLDGIILKIKAAISDGVLSEAQITNSVKRILLLKYNRGILGTKDIALDKEIVKEKITSAQYIAGGEKNRAKEREITEAAVTLVHGDKFTPFKPSASDSVLFLLPYESERASIVFAMKRLEEEKTLAVCKKEYFVYHLRHELNSTLKKKISKANYIVIISYMEGGTKDNDEHWLNSFPQAVADYAVANGKTNCTAVLSIGLPYDVVNFPSLPAFAVFSYIGMEQSDIDSERVEHRYGPNIPAGIEAIFGSFVPSGKMPVTLGEKQ